MRPKIKICILTILSLIAPLTIIMAQTSFPVHGLHQNQPSVHAFKNCTIVIGPGKIIENGMLIVREGIVENAGRMLGVPEDAFIHDLKGAWIFPGFIDAYASYGIDKAKAEIRHRGQPPQYHSQNKGPFSWNQAVKPEFEAAQHIHRDAKKASDWRAAGFTTMHIVPKDGIFRGTSAVIGLGDRKLQDEMISPATASCLSFRKGSSRQSYPSSLMGGIALIRQTFLDAEWYQEVLEKRKSTPAMPSVETNLSLQKLVSHLESGKPFFFECEDWQTVLRASKIAQEFDLPFIFKTSGDSYQRPNALKALNAPLIVPLVFPKAMDLKDITDAREVNLRDLLHWEAASANPGILAQNNIPFALTTNGLKNGKEFWTALQKALKLGLSEEAALAALTTQAAQILGLEKKLGTLEPGKIASFFISDGNIFKKKKPLIFESWVAGRPYVKQVIPDVDIRGRYKLRAASSNFELLIDGELHKPSGKIILQKDTLKANLNVTGRNILLVFKASKKKDAKNWRLSGIVGKDVINGRAQTPEGQSTDWEAKYAGPLLQEKDGKPEKRDEKKQDPVPDIRYPNKAYGLKKIPAQDTVLILNATVWTNTSLGILENTDVLFANGKIQDIGKGLRRPPGVKIIDGTGRHVSTGIIDEHSHIAISRGVNEGTHAISAEVRIGDVINSTDINLYRQLSGGVTTSQLLHGSANPIGGQSALIKLRWGATPEEMKFQDAPPFIKFALGENVKQSNWGDNMRSRYPQTRLGVEQFMLDAFLSALDYRQRLQEDSSGIGNAIPVRRDLTKETLLEILDQKRFITCHSYQQAEIVMLMRLAEKLGFRINTFTHVLEGYKIAGKVLEHGANASTFSDWWAYKYEVIDAIPYNPAIMSAKGINVCINSDDAEMGRRLNQEAAKGVKYGGMSEEEAWKMVTLNPAKALRISDRVGTLEKGKDADIVIWTDRPLSIYARVEKTFVDGRLYFDLEEDRQHRKWIKAERNRLIVKMQKTPEGKKGKAQAAKEEKLYHCETLESEYGYE